MKTPKKVAKSATNGKTTVRYTLLKG